MNFYRVLLFSFFIFSCNSTDIPRKMLPAFDWQGHRGARGLVPENTVPSFLKALEYDIRTLELDATVSQDGKIIISHEPWFSQEISTTPDGTPISAEIEKEYLIYKMTQQEVKAFDVGSRGNARFPQQKKMKTNKPTLDEVVEAVKKYCKEKNHQFPYLNIEIKSRPEWDDELTPAPAEFAQLLLDEVYRLGIYTKTCIQSFDTRSLMAVHSLDEDIITAFLIENVNSFQENMNRLDFTPSIYSPYFQLVNDSLVNLVHASEMKLIPWTVNKVEDMQRLKDMGVDGIITDYPNLIAEVK